MEDMRKKILEDIQRRKRAKELEELKERAYQEGGAVEKNPEFLQRLASMIEPAQDSELTRDEEYIPSDQEQAVIPMPTQEEAVIEQTPVEEAPVERAVTVSEPADRFQQLLNEYRAAKNRNIDKANTANMIAGLGNLVASQLGGSTVDVDIKPASADAEKMAIEKYIRDENAERQGKMTDYQKAMMELKREELSKSGVGTGLKALQNQLKLKELMKSPFEKAKEKAQAKVTEKEIQEYSQLDNDISQINVLSKVFEDYSKDSAVGTGPIAQFIGKWGPKANELDALFKENEFKRIQAMIKGGMGVKGLDSDAEKAAFRQSIPNFGNDDRANYRLILGTKAGLIRQKDYLSRKFKSKDPDNFADWYAKPENKPRTYLTPAGEIKLLEPKQAKLVEERNKNLKPSEKPLIAMDDYLDMITAPKSKGYKTGRDY